MTIILGVLFLLTCSAYGNIAKLQINGWYVTGAAIVLIFIVMNVGMTRIRCPGCGVSLDERVELPTKPSREFQSRIITSDVRSSLKWLPALIPA
jgi:hypothetical protein